MTKKVFVVDGNAAVLEACRIMGEKHVGSVIVNVNGRPEGIFTERDLLSKIMAKGKSAGREKVRNHMSSPLTVINPDMDLKEAARVMDQLKIRRLPVFEKGKMVGIITSPDLVKALARAPLKF